MKTLKWIGWAGVVGLTALVVFLVLRPGPPPESVESPPLALESSNAPSAPVVSAPTQPAPAPRVAATPTAPRLETVVPANGAAPVSVVRVKPGQTLATVNGVAITLKDLVPLPAEKAGTDQLMSAEMYESLLNRAVEREVTFQAAQAQGVELTAAQRQRLANLRTRSEAREPGVFDTVQQNPANVEFEQRDATGLLLQAALAEKAGVPSPHVTAAQVQAHYQQHLADYGALPADPAQRQAAWEKIDQAIRAKLAPQLQAEHQEKFQKFVEQLKASAQIALPAAS